MGVSPEDLVGKDLALYFMTRSGMVKPDAVEMAAEGGVPYGETAAKPKVLQHLEAMQEGLKNLLDHNSRAIMELK